MTSAGRASPVDVVDLTMSDDDEYEEGNRDLYPSRVFDAYWIFAQNPHSVQPITPRSGKWLLFVHVREMDQTWQLIKRETEDGLLGLTSKVATARDNPLATNPNIKVICVYTYDSDDYEDVVRVRDRLRVIGFTKQLRYKTDEATFSGQYSTNSTKVSKYVL